MGFGIRRSLAALSLGVSGVRAQFDLASGSATQTVASSTTSSSAAATWTIQVGKLDHVFSPDVVTAKIGDTIEFDFYPTNHSVVRAAYEHPCVPYELAYPGKLGFFSGFKPVDTVLDNPPKWTVRVNDTEPIFYYCSAPGSCITREMVGVINPNANVSLARQKQLAGQSQFMLQPGQTTPDEASASSSSSSASQSTSTAISSASATAAPAAVTSHSSFPPGAIAGVVIGAVLIIALAAALFYFMGRHRSLKAQEAAASFVPSEKNTHGANSPVGISAMPGDPVVGPGGLVYVPAKAADFAPRLSMPPTYPQTSYPHEAPVAPMSPHSPGASPTQPPVNAHYSTVSAYDMGAQHSPGLRSQSPPAEMYTPEPKFS